MAKTPSKEELSQSVIKKPDSPHATVGVGERTKKGAPAPGMSTEHYACKHD